MNTPERTSLAHGISLYEATANTSGRGFDSRQLHQRGCKVSTGGQAEVDSAGGDRRYRRKTTTANDAVFDQALVA